LELLEEGILATFRASASGYDIRGDTFAGITGTLVERPTIGEFSMADGNRLRIYGEGFQFGVVDGVRTLVAGTVERVIYRNPDGSLIWDMRDIVLSAQVFTQRTEAGDPTAQIISVGLRGDDVVNGGGQADNLNAFDGNDKMLMRAGEDVANGGRGDDIILGGSGNDVLIGGLGEDRLLGEAQDDRLVGGSGSDTLFGGSGNDLLTGDDDSDLMFGGLGDDRLVGGNEADNLNGNEGNDQLEGGDGVDVLRGLEDNDRLFGGNNSDKLFGGDGDDTLDGGAGADLMLGEAGNDILTEGLGNGQLFGGDGDDLCRGGGGNDRIQGNAGNDTLLGDAGDDTLNGGAGDDIVSGFVGIDEFIFGPGSELDQIFDYETGENVDLEGGVTVDDVTTTRDGNDLVITITATPTDQAVIVDFYNLVPSGIVRIDGTDVDVSGLA
jgi:Ca2+-binding RTX toxin-like protein